jgi:iron(III) transport system ATP-binding protein
MVTSDRIAVMNAGRIEQVDAPHAIYTRPKTKFVAGFIGRTNFIEGACNGAEIVFEKFAVPRAAIENGAALSGKITFSVRPQSMRLQRSAPANANGHAQLPVKVLERAYLGEFWNYLVGPEGGSTRLRVTAPPLDIYDVGDSAWLELDPKQMAPIT